VDKNTVKNKLSTIEQQKFIDDMVIRLRNDRKDLEIWVKELKLEHKMPEEEFNSL
jgi:hypothetical protein